MSTIGITLTGADERTDLDQLVRLANLGAEIGLLYSFSPDNRNRYPHVRWIHGAAKHLSGRAALHVCGSRARALLLHGDLYGLTDHVRRVQVNGTLTADELRSLCEGLPDRTVITQHCAANFRLRGCDAGNHALLVDNSGGRGRAPGYWARPVTDKPVGFAGGLGPDNLAVELPKIAAVGGETFWVDMESSLRDRDDWFSVERALQAMVAFEEWQAEQQATLAVKETK